MEQSILNALSERIIIYDGATGTNIQMRNLVSDDFGGPALEGCNEILCVTRPDVIRDIHASFFEVGVDVVETNSFGSIPPVLAEYSIAERSYELNLEAAKLAKQVASDFSADGRYRWVAGSMGPGTKLPSLGQIGFYELRDAYTIQAQALIEGGVDLLLIETCYDLLQIKAAMIGARRAMQTLSRQVPLQVQVTVELTGRMLLGTEIGAALTSIDAMRPDIFGMNCATGPLEMSEHIRYLSRHCRMPISTLPNAGLPSVVDGKMHYDLTPEGLADSLSGFIQEFGVSVVGGCCGTTPEHLAQVVDKCSKLEVPQRSPLHEPGVSSIYTNVSFRQDTSYLSVGERSNANGSKKFREAMLSADWDTCLSVGLEQVKEGAHLIDVCVDYAGADGIADMTEIVSRFATQVSLPLMLDSTEAPVIEAGLIWIGGRAILNSVNLEDGDGPGTRLDLFLNLARTYGAGVVCTCIDEKGQARTAEWKLQAAQAIFKIATERYGLEAGDLLFDPLVLPISTGLEESRRDAIETIEAIRLIKKEIPGSFTIIGLSNISFGLNPAARHVLNSVFLSECVKAGLDAAIAHSGKILPLNRIDERHKEICLDLIYDRRRSGKSASLSSPGNSPTTKQEDYDPLQALLTEFQGVVAAGPTKEDRSDWPLDKRLSQRIIDGDRDGLEDDLSLALDSGLSALTIVNDVLLSGMKVVGELFGKGEMQLPFVLQSAETMKQAVSFLEPYMDKTEDAGKGKIVLATVKGDVHDIGKNLVDIILTNNGFEVYNLGIKVSISEMISKAQEVRADAIGMSGLLVKSTLIMKENLEELNNRSLSDIPVLLGGAALTRTYVEGDLRKIYEGRLFYGRDAFEGLRTMNRLMEFKDGGEEDPTFGRELSEREMPMRMSERDAIEGERLRSLGLLPKRSPHVATDNAIPTPPFVGVRVAKGISVDEIANFINETALFRNQWGLRPQNGEVDADFKARIRPLFREQLSLAKTKEVLAPQVVWGYFPANSDGDDLVIYTDESRSQERMRFNFPRQPKEPYFSIPDFFRSSESGEIDWACFMLVTMGPKVSEETARLFALNKYQEYLYLHGLGVEMAESLAEFWHKRIREDWGFVNEDGPTLSGLFKQQYRGGRYSFGYPACPDLEDNEKVVELLGGHQIGVEVSEGYQLHPEQTTLALICHHPQAKYFVAPRLRPGS